MSRLEQIESLVTKKEVIDIGSDHGYLIVNLFKNKKITKAHIGEVNVDPLLNAYYNIKKNNFDHLTKFYLSDGLKNINPELKNVDVILAGMGGKLIWEIISKNHLENVEFIIQPNNNEIFLRNKLKEKDWEIEKELLVEENEIIYSIMKINPLKKNTYDENELILGRYEKNDLYIKKIIKENEYLKTLLKKIPEGEKIILIKKIIKLYQGEL